MQTHANASGRDSQIELTIRGLILGALITLVFTAANVYLGLKVGLTFASSIPAAVISMAVLRAFRTSTIYENNIVQTVASAAGTLSSIIFVLPGLVMVGWWSGFPFWQSFGICAVGGILGVMYTVPLRRALVTNSDLPYPEGVAAAEVLRVGSGARDLAENRAGLLALGGSAIVSAAFAAIAAMGIFAGTVATYARIGKGITGIGLSLSMALIGAGYLIGLSVGSAMFVGLVIAWGIATPILTALHPATGALDAAANAIWSTDVRFIGAGAIGVSALWALGRLARPVWGGMLSAIAASRPMAAAQRAALPRVERDIPIGLVGLISLVCLIPLAILLASFLTGGVLASMIVPLVVGSIVYIVIVGFLVAAASGYMAGLIGSSNSPISGLAILAAIGASLLLLLVAKHGSPAVGTALVAFALFVTAVVIAVATIANDNLQDLKTGQLVDATPWRQQVALMIGVIAGAIVIPPILDLLNRAYGFMGTVASASHVAAVAQPLPAPQATLISALAKGVIQGHIDWGMIGVGALVGVAIVVIDEVLRLTSRFRLPPLAVGLGIYLPASTIAPVVLGALLGWGYNRWVKNSPSADAAKRMGVLIASGLIVGESLFGVVLAGIIVFSGNASPLAVVGAGFAVPGTVIGIIAFVVANLGLFAWSRKLSQ